MRNAVVLTLFSSLLLVACGPGESAETNEPQRSGPDSLTFAGRWSVEEANAYYAKWPWQVGSNFNPRDAINQLEMWQAETFNPEMIDEELGWAAGIGMNSMRVYLHNLVWEQDSAGLLERMERYLEIADGHGISTTFVLFDAVWDPVSELGEQPAPRPHVHNSGWVQSPQSRQLLRAERYYPKGKSYVQGILRHFRDDDRIFMW
ncbi:MAG: 1,4-beta-xylanase, partial [Bacteroidota bacterium]